MPELGEFLNSINVHKKDILDNPDTLEQDEKSYSPYITNRLLSYFPDSLMYSNDMNRYPFLDKRMQYDYLRLALKSRKRFSKFQKPDVPENLEVVKEYFGYSNMKARETLKILTDEQLEYIKSKLKRGGKKPD